MAAQTRIRTARALVAAVVPSIMLSEAGLLAARTFIPMGVLEKTNDIVGNYLQTLGTIYAVLLAFVVFVVWSQFNDARQYVEREANELLDLHRTARALPAATREPIQQSLGAYVDAVLAHEWEGMKCVDERKFGEGAALLDRVWGTLHDFEPVGEEQSVVFGELLARFNDLSDLRSNRLTSACLRVPLALRIFLNTGGMMTVASMYLFAIDRWEIHALLTGALAGMLSHVLYVVRDLDNCFTGEWQVPRGAFERLQRLFKAA